MSKIDIIEAASDLGVTVEGADKGPDILIQSIKNINKSNIYKINKGNVTKEKDAENKQKNLREVNAFNEKLYKRVQEILKNGNIPFTIGGDHSIAIASALASIGKYKRLGIIWFDSHGDFNTFETTETGNIHGLPLAVITGYERKKLAEFHTGNFYPYENTVIVGARDVDKLEWVNLKKAGITVFSTEDIRKIGVETVVKKAISIATNGTAGMHISYDVDLIDPEIAPGVSVPAIDGITEAQAKQIVEEFLKEKEKIKSIDVVEFNPLRDKENKTKKIALDIIETIKNNLLSEKNCLEDLQIRNEKLEIAKEKMVILAKQNSMEYKEKRK